MSNGAAVLLADKFHSVFICTTPRPLRRDKDMDIGILPVPDIVDKSDLGADIIPVTASAIDKDLRSALF